MTQAQWFCTSPAFRNSSGFWERGITDGSGRIIARVCGATVEECDERANKTAAVTELLRIAETIREAYATGEAATFHTRLNELAGGDFASLLMDTLDKARGEHPVAA